MTDIFFFRSLATGVAKLGWKEVFSPGGMRLMFGKWVWDDSFHAAWQIGDKVFHAVGSNQGRKWLIRVFEGSKIRVVGQSADDAFADFTVKMGFPFPAASRGLGQLCMREADCLTAMIRAVNRANYGVLERVLKAAVIQIEGLVQEEELEDHNH